MPSQRWRAQDRASSSMSPCHSWNKSVAIVIHVSEMCVLQCLPLIRCQPSSRKAPDDSLTQVLMKIISLYQRWRTHDRASSNMCQCHSWNKSAVIVIHNSDMCVLQYPYFFRVREKRFPRFISTCRYMMFLGSGCPYGETYGSVPKQYMAQSYRITYIHM